MGVESGLILAASIAVIAAFAAPWLWPAIERARAPEPEDDPEAAAPPAPPVPDGSVAFEISRDDVVVRLRDSGLTYQRIAERLTADFGQQMSASTARRICLRTRREGRSRREDDGDGSRRRDPGSRTHGAGGRRPELA